MKYRRYRSAKWVSVLLTTLVVFITVAPVSASKQAPVSYHHTAATPLKTTIYLTTATLQSLFQQRINALLPDTVNGAINQMVGKLSATNQDWAKSMANTLIQPSATLTQLTPQQGGLAATVRLSLYPGDPKPTDVNMLVTFSVLNQSTMQVSVQPVKGSPTLIDEPLTTVQVPFGQLSSVTPTVSCGDSALALGLQIPVSLDQSTPVAQSQQGTTSTSATLAYAQHFQEPRAAQDAVSSYVEIPAASLSSLGSGIGSLPISNVWTAQNIQPAVQGNDLVVTSDIVLADTSIKLATATTYLQPAAVDGKLVVHVAKTTLTVLIFTFPNDTYNSQIEQTLNTRLGDMLAGKFNVTAAATGANTHIPCAAHDSLILTGTISIA